MKTWQTVDKSGWPARGAWDDEPDKAQWIDEATGLDCLIVRGDSGGLCGYVGVPESHPLFGKGYNEAYDYADVDVHGGLTFASRCADSEDPARHICHTGDVANKTVWWFGFDCAHGGDISPAYDHGMTEYFSTYKSLQYVKGETENLARQLVEVSK